MAINTMKRLVPIILLCFAFIECGFASEPSPKSECYDYWDVNYPLNGNVRYIQQTKVHYIATANEVAHVHDSWINLIRFNAKGNLTKVYSYDASDDGSFEKETCKYKYDKQNNLIYANESDLFMAPGRTKFVYDSKGQIIKEKYVSIDQEEVYVYNDNGYLESSFNCVKDESEPFCTYKYDEWCNIIESKSHDNSFPPCTWEYKYGENGRVLEKRKFEDNKMVEHRTYQYDENGNEVRVNCCDADGVPTMTIENMYDQSNKLIVVKEIHHKGVKDHVYLTINEIHYK